MANELVLTEVSALIEGDGDYRTERSPITRSEERAVARVQKPSRDPLDVSTLQAADISIVAQNLMKAREVGISFTAQQAQDLATLQQAIIQRWEQCLAMMDTAEQIKATDVGGCAYMRQQAAFYWDEARDARIIVGNLQQLRSAAMIADFQHHALNRFPWLSSQKHLDAVVKWVCKERGITEADVWAESDPNLIWDTLEQYERVAKARRVRLPADTVEQKIRAAKRPKARENQMLSQQQKADLVASLLSEIG